MRVLDFSEMKNYGSDVYEFRYEYCNSDHIQKQKNSLFVPWEDFKMLCPLIDRIIKNYHYYGPQKVTYDEWSQIKQLSEEGDEAIVRFFHRVDTWIKCRLDKKNCFWILGP